MTRGMHPSPSPLGFVERQHHASGGGRPTSAAGLAAGLAAVPRTPSTPRKDKSHGHSSGRESSALQDPGLKDYVGWAAFHRSRLLAAAGLPS